MKILKQMEIYEVCRLKNKVDGMVIYGRYLGNGKALAKTSPSEYQVDDAEEIHLWEKRDAKLVPSCDDVDWQNRTLERSKEISKQQRIKVGDHNYGRSIKMRWEEMKWVRSYQKERKDLASLLYRGWEKNLAWRLRRWWVVRNKTRRRYLRSAITFAIVVFCENPGSVIAGKRIRIHPRIVENKREILPAEYFDLNDFDDFVRQQILNRRKGLKGLKEFQTVVARQALQKELSITSRQLRNLINEGFLKSQDKKDVIDFIARREIDPHKPGRKRKK
jgi:hypothetical protein